MCISRHLLNDKYFIIQASVQVSLAINTTHISFLFEVIKIVLILLEGGNKWFSYMCGRVFFKKSLLM